MSDTSEEIVKAVQTRLASLGWYGGEIDGIAGPETDAALTGFKRAIGFRPRPTPVLLTLAVLYSDEAPIAEDEEPEGGPNALLTAARATIGMREAPGSTNNNSIIELARKAGIDWYSSDSTPWCAVWVNGMLVEAGYPSTKSALARSFVFDEYGDEVDPEDVRPGDIVVFPRGTKAWQGHVEIIEEVLDDEWMVCIGGNVSDRVKRSHRRIDSTVPHGIRRPRYE